MLCVRPGVLDVRARPLRWSKELISEDFPTFERPRNAISGRPSSVQCRLSYALLTKSADKIFMEKLYEQGDVHGKIQFYADRYWWWRDLRII